MSLFLSKSFIVFSLQKANLYERKPFAWIDLPPILAFKSLNNQSFYSFLLEPTQPTTSKTVIFIGNNIFYKTKNISNTL